RRTHLYAKRKTGQGKSVLLENMMLDDLAASRGFAFLEPAHCIPPSRIDDIIYFNPTDERTIMFRRASCGSSATYARRRELLNCPRGEDRDEPTAILSEL